MGRYAAKLQPLGPFPGGKVGKGGEKEYLFDRVEADIREGPLDGGVPFEIVVGRARDAEKLGRSGHVVGDDEGEVVIGPLLFHGLGELVVDPGKDGKLLYGVDGLQHFPALFNARLVVKRVPDLFKEGFRFPGLGDIRRDKP